MGVSVRRGPSRPSWLDKHERRSLGPSGPRRSTRTHAVSALLGRAADAGVSALFDVSNGAYRRWNNLMRVRFDQQVYE